MPLACKNKILISGIPENSKRMLSTLLSSEGYEVLHADDGTIATETLKRANPDVAILDVSLQNGKGQPFIGAITSEFPQTSFLMVTGYESIQEARNAVLNGADDYILRPLQKDEVLKRVKSSIDKASYLRQNISINNATRFLQNNSVSNLPVKKESLYRIIVESALNQTSSSLGALVVYDEEKRKFDIAYSSYIAFGNVRFPHDYNSYSVVNFIVNNRKPILLALDHNHALSGTITIDKLSADIFPEILPFENEVIIYPMTTSQSKVIGFIVLSKKNGELPFSQSDLTSLGIIANQSSVSVHNAYLVEGLERNYVNTLMALNAILEAKHPYTKGHTQRVTLYSTTLAREMGLSAEEMQVMRDGAMLHDIGKIGVTDAILNKEGSLNEAEFNIIKRHPIIGEKIIKPIKFLEKTLPIIRHHHERMDGRGWPDGLSGVQIPLLVRICTIADAYDAMSSDRPYRETMNLDEIRRQLICHCGTQFDEELVEIFLRLLDREVISLPEQIEQNTLLKV